MRTSTTLQANISPLLISTRRLDDLGRVVIPKELRRALGLEEGNELEIRVEYGEIRICKATPEDGDKA